MTGFAGLLGASVEESGDGRARLSLEAGEQHLNGAGTVHGGVLASLVDMAMGEAVRSQDPEPDAAAGPDAGGEQVPATSQLTVTYLRPGTPGRLVVTAAVRKRGESLTVCEAGVEQDGRPLVDALATFALVRR